MSDDAQADAIARGDILPPDSPDPAQSDESGQQASPPSDSGTETPSETPSSDADPGEGEAAPSAATAADGDSTPPKDDGSDEPRIPKARFDQAVEKERNEKAELAARLQQYEQRAQQQKDAEDFEASLQKQKELLKQHSSLLADGDLDKASDVMEQVLQLRDDMQNARMERRAANATNAAKIEVQYDATVTRLEAEYPEINPDSEDFDQNAVRRVQALVTGIMQNEGKSPADALQEATDILLKPAKEAKGKDLRDKPSEAAIEQGMRRTQQQIDKNIKANAQQPPSAAEVGQDHDATGGPLNTDAITSMSWEEFVQVPDEELAKLRGDYLN